MRALEARRHTGKKKDREKKVHLLIFEKSFSNAPEPAKRETERHAEAKRNDKICKKIGSLKNERPQIIFLPNDPRVSRSSNIAF